LEPFKLFKFLFLKVIIIYVELTYKFLGVK